MHNSFRLIVLLFLAALILHNYNSNKVLNLALDTMRQDMEHRTRAVAEQTFTEIKHPPFSDETLRQISTRRELQAIVLYGPDSRILQRHSDRLPPELEKKLGKLSNFPQSSSEMEPYFIHRVDAGNDGQVSAALFLFQGEKFFRLERSAKIISYLNLFVIGFAAILGFYFIESTLRPLRVLMQTARSAPADLPEVGKRNDSEFLIGTFKGVIAKLKENEQELNRLHRAEKARADDVEQLNQDLLRSIGSGLILIDKAGKVFVFNHAAESIFEVSRLTALKQPYESLLKRISPVLAASISECLAHRKQIVNAELEIQSAKANRRFVSASIMPLQDRQQQFSGVFCIFSDITEFTMLQQHISQKEKFASLGEMAAGVAHEFRNSIATITGYLQMLDDRIHSEQKTYIAPIHKEIHSLQKVVNDFLSFARPVQPQFEQVNLKEIIQECIAETAVTSRDVSFQLNGEFSNIAGDESMLRQIFSNLLRNAVEALKESQRKGEIRVQGTLREDTRILQVEVADNGSGIRAADLDRIFTPFYSTKQNGVGLGLAIAQKLVLSHNGSIQVESTSEGSRFRIQFPVQ